MKNSTRRDRLWSGKVLIPAGFAIAGLLIVVFFSLSTGTGSAAAVQGGYECQVKLAGHNNFETIGNVRSEQECAMTVYNVYKRCPAAGEIFYGHFTGPRDAEFEFSATQVTITRGGDWPSNDFKTGIPCYSKAEAKMNWSYEQQPNARLSPSDAACIKFSDKLVQATESKLICDEYTLGNVVTRGNCAIRDNEYHLYTITNTCKRPLKFYAISKWNNDTLGMYDLKPGEQASTKEAFDADYLRYWRYEPK